MTITAQVIADSVSPEAVRLTTLQLKYPRFIHSELMTHRVFSRNASSSRAIPVAKQISEIIRDTAMPIHWGKNQKGMQADEETRELLWGIMPNNFQGMTSTEAWIVARDRAIEVAEAFDKAGYHKQIVNRLLEPFAHINVIVTATQFSNFYALRQHKDAMPEMRELADQMWNVMYASKPQEVGYREWHLPYISMEERAKHDNSNLIQCSVARCARVSYLTHEFKTPTLAQDLTLYKQLAESIPLHASPTEHQAFPDQVIDGCEWKRKSLHGNFTGWCQYRKQLPGECQ